MNDETEGEVEGGEVAEEVGTTWSGFDIAEDCRGDEDEYDPGWEFILTEDQLRFAIRMQFCAWRRYGNMGWAKWRSSTHGIDFLGLVLVEMLRESNPAVFDEVWREI